MPQVCVPEIQEVSDRFSGLGLFENEIVIAVCCGRVTMRLVRVGVSAARRARLS